MPTVLRQDGFDVLIWTDDHPPPHVHVRKAEGVLIVNLGSEAAKPSVRESYGLKAKDERKAFELVIENQAFLLVEWRRVHGERENR